METGKDAGAKVSKTIEKKRRMNRDLCVGKGIARMNQFASGIVCQPWWTEPGESLDQPRHGGFETGETPVESFNLPSHWAWRIGNSLEVSRGVENGRAGEIGKAAGISQDGNGLEAMEFFVGDAKINETIANVHRGTSNPEREKGICQGRSFAPKATASGLPLRAERELISFESNAYLVSGDGN